MIVCLVHPMESDNTFMSNLSKDVNLAQHLHYLCHIPIQISLAEAFESKFDAPIRQTVALVNNGLTTRTEWLTLHLEVIK